MLNEDSPMYLFNTFSDYNILTNEKFNRYWKNAKKTLTGDSREKTFYNFHPIHESEIDFVIYGLKGTNNKLYQNSNVDDFPDLLREHSLKFPLFPRLDTKGTSGFYDFYNEEYILETISFLDYGDIDISDMKNIKKLDNLIIKTCGLNIPFVTIGGDHAITYFNIKSIHNNTGKKPILIQFDAHQDLGVHEVNNKDVHQGNFVSYLIKEDLVTAVLQVGIRGIRSRNQIGTCEKVKILPDAKHDLLSADLLNELISEFDEQDIYISVDFDVLNPSVFSFVDFPMPGGLSLEKLSNLVQEVFKSKGNVIGTDMVEINSNGDVEKNDYNIPIYFLAMVLHEYEKRMV